ncbi:MAG TPA: hypothetical protein VFT82_01985 [Candidatus Paceibacterota bacterium]|nr:hypothetical protein [Candidatus Paceibacterota bacterium]
MELYSGPVRHIFFHSLIVYPEMAAKDSPRAELYANNMITVEEFKSVLQKLYDNGYALIDSRKLYEIDPSGHVTRASIFMPAGKKPLVLSLDDLNYYETMKNGGMARKLVFDKGVIKAETAAPDGSITNLLDGDAVPAIDSFIREHPDFSVEGARGIIGITGYDGILGYRTELSGAAGNQEKLAAKPVIEALKKEGWVFASHSFSHDHSFMTGTVSTTTLAADISAWKSEVGSLVGPTDIYIGPFGQVFKAGDPRRAMLIAAGFHALYGVGIDGYQEFFPDSFVADRIDIDGYRLRNDGFILRQLLGL